MIFHKGIALIAPHFKRVPKLLQGIRVSSFQPAACLGTPPNKPRRIADKELYHHVYKRSLESPQEFWAEAAEKLVWNKKWNKVVDDSDSPFTKW